MTPLHERLAEMLALIWRGIGASYKSRYRMTIWQQFEDQIRSAAYTSNLSKFVSSLCFKLNADIGTNAEHRARFDELFRQLSLGTPGGEPQQRPALKLLREETTLLVLMIRVANQERREAWEASQAENLFDGIEQGD